MDEKKRAKGLRPLRDENFTRILDVLDAVLAGRKGALLDVGCAHGWFLAAARRRGFTVLGIEPDPIIGAEARALGLEILSGFFPDAIPSGRRFDIITFNDVFEHLPDPAVALAACRKLLSPDGLLMINLPSSDGAFYRLAELLDRFGLRAPFERMWQVNFISPHRVYMNAAHLDRLATLHGFERRGGGSLPSISIAGLWPRLRYDSQAPAIVSAFQWAGIAVASPLLKTMLPPDIVFAVYSRNDG